MSSTCNTTRNEKGGKDLLLKLCTEVEATVDASTDANNVIIPSHGLEVNDIVRFDVDDLGTLSGVTATGFYYVKSVEDSSTVTLSESPGATAVSFTGSFTDTVSVFKTVAGLRNASISINAEMVDITNYGSNQFREILSGAGLKSMSISGDGVFNSDTDFNTFQTAMLDQDLVCAIYVDVVAGRIYHSCAKITSMEFSGEFSGEANYTMALESSGTITVNQAS